MKYDINTLRDILGDKKIVDSLIQYLNSDTLNDFCETLVDENDIEYFDTISDFSDWYNEQSKTDRDHIEEVICGNCDYCAEPHQLNEDDMYDCIDYTAIKEDLDNWFSVNIDINSDFEEFCKGVMAEAFACDPTCFYI